MSPDVITTSAPLSTRTLRASPKIRCRDEHWLSWRMAEILLTAAGADGRPLWLLTESDLPRWLSEQPAQVRTGFAVMPPGREASRAGIPGCRRWHRRRSRGIGLAAIAW